MSADFTPEKEDYGVLSPFKMQVLTNFPYIEADFDALTNYGLLCKVVEYLNNVIHNENEVTEQVNSLYNAYVSLQNYVNTYFDNLDISEEVDRKIDELVEDGTLTNLIKDYVDPIYQAYETSINNAIEMQNDNISQTLSNYSNKLNGLYNYSPIAVNSTSSMTDTSKIYVNTTNGKWYYYDEDSWEIGGTYQSSSNDTLLDSNSTNAVQNKVLTNALDNVLDISTESGSVTSTVTPTWTDGYITANGTVHESTSYKYSSAIEVKEGDVVGYIGEQNLNSWIRFLCAYDSNDDPVSASGSDTAITTYTVPEGVASIKISCSYSDMKIILVTITNTQSIQTIKSKIENNKTTTKTSVISYTTTSGMMNVTGIASENQYYVYTNKISVNAGDVIHIDSNQYKTSGARIVCAYIGDKACFYKGYTSSSNDCKEYIVPEYVTAIQLTLPVGHNWAVSKITSYNSKLYLNNNLGGYKYVGDIEQNATIKFDYSNLKPSYNINYSSHITSLDSIEIGYTKNDTFTRLLQVTDTNIIVYVSDNNYLTIPHGLTIANDIGISFMIHPYNKNGYDTATVKLFSNGEEYTTSAPNIYTFGYNIEGQITLKVNNSVVNNCSFSLGLENIDKPIWIFGDSWISNYESRWVYHLVHNDYNNNCFMNGYPGEGSVNGLTALQNLIKLRSPKYLIWLYGMNDGDNQTSVNSDWLSTLNSVIEICQANNIELILATIPSTPTIMNYYKNQIVKNSGYRYFDQESALTVNGSWISGYASVDGNHTSNAGAKALYYKLITDVPEITNYR